MRLVTAAWGDEQLLRGTPEAAQLGDL